MQLSPGEGFCSSFPDMDAALLNQGVHAVLKALDTDVGSASARELLRDKTCEALESL